MIVTKSWLEEFIDLRDIESEEICKVLNSIGLEVDSLTKMRTPAGVVVGKVLECEKHPDADKLNVCQVDLGDRVEQIVCGAKNVAKGQIVAVATVGADLGDGFVIKEAKLRGVASNGMICASNEIGLPKLNDGIWVLDESLGDLELGRELCEFEAINDDIIEIELTANRGDCLSIYGVARDLSAAFDRELKPLKQSELAINSSIKVEDDIPVSLMVARFEKPFCSNALIDLRLAFVDKYSENEEKNIINYTTHATGVLLRSYHLNCQALRVKLSDELPVIFCDDKIIGIVGVNQDESQKEESESFIVEASYINPDFISRAVMKKDIKKDELFYNASRGSESDLAFSFIYLASIVGIRSLTLQSSKQFEKYSKSLIIEQEYIDNFIGQHIESEKIISILKKLRFQVEANSNTFHIEIPTFRHDIGNKQDIIEEIVRMIGIDNLKSTPFVMKQQNIFNNSFFEYKKRDFFRKKSIGAGYSEAICYIFDSKELQERFELKTIKDEFDLLNPITKELNTLRTTLVLHHIESASQNIKNSKKSVKLFEIGRVFDESRNESQKIAFIASGEKEMASIANSAKAQEYNFYSFADEIMRIVGDFELKVMRDDLKLLNPYEKADIYIDREKVGFMGSLHISVRDEYDLPKTFICEIDFDKLRFEKIEAEEFSKYPSLSRDVSLLKPKDLSFEEIREFIKSVKSDEIVSFYPIDLFRSDEFKNKESLTIRFIIQSKIKTLNEEEIGKIMDDIVNIVRERFALELR